MEVFIKNIDHETVLKLTDLVEVQPGQVVSKTLAQNEALSITLFHRRRDGNGPGRSRPLHRGRQAASGQGR